MNKYEEELSEIYSYDGCKLELEDLPLTKELVELHTPKKVIPRFKTNNGIDEYIGADCPNCELFLIDEYSFCHDCGQALDWSDR